MTVNITRPVIVTDADRRAEPNETQMKVQAQMKEAAEVTRLRKLDTRGKIILGGAVLDFIERGSPTARKLFDEIVSEMPRNADATTIRQIRKFWGV
jgi:hypothetical protein